MKTAWLFEPFHINNSLVKIIYSSLKPLCKSPSELQVLKLTTGTESELLTAYDVPAEERFSEYPKKLIQKIFKKNDIKIEASNVIVVNKNTFSTSTAVKEVLAIAKKNKTSLLTLMTKNKSSLNQLFVGSFAEELLLQSPIDLLVFNPSNKIDHKIKKIIYACDLSGNYLADLKKAIYYCKQYGAELVVFHQSQYFSTAAVFEKTALINEAKNKQLAEKILAQLKLNKIKGQVIIGTKLRTTYEYILSEAKKHKADLIIARTKESRLGAFVGGSVVRQLVRLSHIPILILRG